MPHKHTRREKDLSTFDLPPTQIAKPLPPTTISKKKQPAHKKNDDGIQKTSTKRKRTPETQDAPRAFKRLMAFAEGKKPRSGLDNGAPPPSKKAKKKAAAAADSTETPAPENENESKPELKIRPGEKLSEFSQRVDAALPISGLVNNKAKGGKDPLGLKIWRTRKEMKMHKLYDEWRIQDAKIKEKREEELEALEEREMEDEAMGVTWKLNMEAGKKKKGKKGSRYLGESKDKEDDPWEEIKKKRGEAKVGLNDVAEAPPELKLPSKKLLVGGATVDVEGIPKAAGSLRQREELQKVRGDVVAQYRKLMAERRPNTLV